ncbi:hypothetical protein MM239_16065 [Belliella sp. DSM 111904]|uniref:DUF4136 domain-containing protein n=1 Tax=Belliella filtrata TaxID=2923435 RepID=A0ABS9V407_9BACT|nr:hypothetical protein [Belliella filtrata]MCH7410925.1 hypothetical protein [Belliella filtrata]
MKKILLYCIIILAVSSCVNVNLSGNKLTDQTKDFESFLFLFSDADGSFGEWNEENFNRILKTNFNGQDQESKRETFAFYLRKQLKDKKIYSANQVFAEKKSVDYADFMATIEHINFDGILLIQDKGAIPASDVKGDVKESKSYTGYNIFLIDKTNYRHVWSGDAQAEASEMQEIPRIYDEIVKELVFRLTENGFVK